MFNDISAIRRKKQILAVEDRIETRIEEIDVRMKKLESKRQG